MRQKLKIDKILLILKKSSIISKIEIITFDEIAEKSVYKIRCRLIPSKYKLDIRFIQTEKEILYSYQLFTDRPIARWDNAPHYPDIKTYPHHFHSKEGNVIESELRGVASEDLRIVLSTVRNILGEQDEKGEKDTLNLGQGETLKYQTGASDS